MTALDAARRRLPGPAGRGWRTAGWAAVAVLLAVGVRRALADPLSAPVPTRANAVLTAGQDFRDATYFPVKELVSGGDPYDPAPMFAHWPVNQEFDLYAPLHLVLHLPFAALPYRAALLLFSCLALAALVGIGLVSARVMRLPGGWLAAWLVAGLVVLSQIGKSAISIGQINPVVGLGAVLALTQAGRSRISVSTRRPASAGLTRSAGVGSWASGFGSVSVWGSVGLALAWTKPQFAIPIAVLLLARGAWRQVVLGTGLAFVVSLPVVAVLVARAGGIGGFLDVVQRNLSYATHTRYAAVDSPTGSRVDLAAVFYRLTGWLPPGAELAALVLVLGLAAWLVGSSVAGRSQVGRSAAGSVFDVPELFLVSLACLVCIAHQQGESLLTVPALVGAAAAWVRRERVSRWLWPVAALTLVPALRVSAVQSFTAAHLGVQTDRLVEGVCLVLAFAGSCLLVHDRRFAQKSAAKVVV